MNCNTAREIIQKKSILELSLQQWHCANAERAGQWDEKITIVIEMQSKLLVVGPWKEIGGPLGNEVSMMWKGLLIGSRGGFVLMWKNSPIGPKIS